MQLLSTGVIKVKRLNPQAVVAFSAPPPVFDPAVYHRLTVEARGDLLTVALDGAPVTFDQWGKPVGRVSIPPAWNGPPALGENGGAAGIAFAAEDNRALAGGQRARNIVLERMDRP